MLGLQFIILLNTLGIPDHVFEAKQADYFQHVSAMTTDPTVALKSLMTAGKVGMLWIHTLYVDL